MNTKETDLYISWKNKLKKYQKIESLKVIWAYHLFRQFWTSIPGDISVPDEFLKEDKWFRYLEVFFLFIYLRDILAYWWDYAQHSAKSIPYTLRNKYEFGDLHNLKEAIIWFESKNGIDLSLRLFRLAHQQFKWQEISKDYSHYINTYSFLYSEPKINDLTESILWLSAKRILEIGFLFFSGFLSNFIIKIDSELVNPDELECFLDLFWITISELSHEFKSLDSDSFSFDFSWLNQLLNKPIIIAWNDYICPIPLVLLRGIFEWIFYKCINNWNFTSQFWNDCFQKLCYNIITTSLTSSALKFGTDNDLIKDQNKSAKTVNSDFWILEEECVLFLDAKYTSIPEYFYINIQSFEDININKFVLKIKQWLEVVLNYRKWTYLNTIWNKQLKEFVIFLLPFDTYLGFGVPGSTLFDYISTKIYADNPEYFGIHFMFMGINELHRFLQTWSKYTFKKILELKFSSKYIGYEMLWFMNEISQDWYEIDQSQYDFWWFDYMNEIIKKYQPV